MTHLYLVRHGETDWNAQGCYLGHRDIPLNARGCQQAEALARRLQGIVFDSVYTSDLIRAFETATILQPTHKPVPLLWLRELNFGDFEGLTYQGIAEQYPKQVSEWQSNISQAPPRGESLAQLADRVMQFIEHLAIYRQEQHLLIVSHGGPLRVLLSLLLGHPLEKYWQLRLDLGSLTIISTYPSGAILNRMNDISHIEEGPLNAP
jgi:alpha-ribazole phosphatase/probable phosphoglycerate mutase